MRVPMAKSIAPLFRRQPTHDAEPLDARQIRMCRVCQQLALGVGQERHHRPRGVARSRPPLCVATTSATTPSESSTTEPIG